MKNMRWIICSILLLSAVALNVYFVEYRVQPVLAVPGSSDFIVQGKGEILFLGWTTLSPKAGSDLARFHGRISAERGLFSRDNYPPLLSGIAGIIVPLALISFSIYITLPLRRSLHREKKN